MVSGERTVLQVVLQGESNAESDDLAQWLRDWVLQTLMDEDFADFRERVEATRWSFDVTP